jgi:multimeric flavodoxin WrbA
MKLIAVNGSPRKDGNTAIMLNHVMQGAASKGFETERVDLYDLDFKGCISCFSCKLKNGKSYGKCAIQDDLSLVLAKIHQTDALILGSPNYIGSPTGMMKAFIERLVYPYIVYDSNWSTLFPKKIPIAFIYTMSSSADWMKKMGYDQSVVFTENILKLFFGEVQSIIVNDTSMFNDYSKYVSSRFDPIEKARIHAEQFPVECKKAFDIGARLVEQISEPSE